MKYKPEVGLVKTEKAEIEYVKFGTGEKSLVLIPGVSLKSLVTSANSVARAYEQFCEEYTVYMLLPRKNVTQELTLFYMAEDVADAMKKLGLLRSYVVGASMGGMIAQTLAINHPELVMKVVLCASSSKMNEESTAVMDKFIELAEAKDARALCSEFVDRIYTQEFSNKYKDFILEINKEISQKEFETFVILSNIIKSVNTYDELEKIKCPMLVLGAWGDRTLTGEASVKIAEKTNCEIFMYDESYSHAIYDEAEDIKDRIQKFFNEE